MPNWRFPEFSNDGEWEEKSLDMLCEILNSRRMPISSSSREKGKYPYYGASGIIDYVKDYIFDEQLILIGEDGAKWSAFEKTAFVVNGKYWVNNHAHVIKTIKVNDFFLQNYLNLIDLYPYITGFAPPKLTLANLKQLPIQIPSNPKEQEKIADCLSSLDNLIEAQDKKVQALKEHKKALMQNLFPAEGKSEPNWRFPEFSNDGEWEEKPLTNISEIVRGGSPRPIDKYITLEETGLNWLKIGDIDQNSKYVISTKEKIKSTGLSKTREVNYGDLILSNSMSFGRPYILKIRACIHDGWIAIRNIKKDIETDYLYYFILSYQSQKYFLNNAAGAAVLNLNADIVKSLPILYPNPKEQQKIADCLSSLDNLIEAQDKKVQALKEHKKALMQNLFPQAKE
ncbi:MAG: restriction endonuclease subunit S [Campylobacterota bacterium]